MQRRPQRPPAPSNRAGEPDSGRDRAEHPRPRVEGPLSPARPGDPPCPQPQWHRLPRLGEAVQPCPAASLGPRRARVPLAPAHTSPGGVSLGAAVPGAGHPRTPPVSRGTQTPSGPAHPSTWAGSRAAPAHPAQQGPGGRSLPLSLREVDRSPRPWGGGRSKHGRWTQWAELYGWGGPQWAQPCGGEGRSGRSLWLGYARAWRCLQRGLHTRCSAP